MPKETKAPDQPKASPYHRRSKDTEPNKSETFLASIGDEKEWEKAICPICMEPPHNAVLLLCSSREKGCRPYMCNTGNCHSNCLSQFRKSSSTSPGLSCPLCRGKISLGIVTSRARSFMNTKQRSCALETCQFSGNYSELEKHAKLVHPGVQPSESDPIRQQTWTCLERERQARDLQSAFQRELVQERREQMNLERGSTEIELSLSVPERPSPSLQETGVSASSGVSGRPRRTARMSVNYDLVGMQLASRNPRRLE